MEESGRYYGKHERRPREEYPQMAMGDYESFSSEERVDLMPDHAREYGNRLKYFVRSGENDSVEESYAGPRNDFSTDRGEWSAQWRPAFMPERQSGARVEEDNLEVLDRKGDRRGNLGRKLKQATALALVVIGVAIPWDNKDGNSEDGTAMKFGSALGEVTKNAPIFEMSDGRLVQNGMVIKDSEPGGETIMVEAPAEEHIGEQAEEAVAEEVGSADSTEVVEPETVIGENAETGIDLEEAETPEVEAERIAKYDVIGQKDIKGLGTIDKYKYSGGYIRENDPYYVNFAGKSTEDSFGAPLEGATPVERVQDLTKRWAASPKELVTMISHMNIESEMGIAEFKSMDDENAFADKLAGYGSEEYDEFVNRFYMLFYGKVAGAKTSRNCFMARDMMDRTGDPSDGEQSEVVLFGQLRGNGGALQVTFLDKNGKNVISDEEAFKHEFATMSEADRKKAKENNVGRTAWINIGEDGGEEGRGGDIEYKAGGKKAETPTPEPEKPTPEPEKPTPVVTPEPTPVVTPEPEKPTPVVTPDPTPVVTPEPKPTPVVTPEPEKPTPVITPEPEKPTPVVTPEPTPVVTPEPKPTKNPEAIKKPIEEVKQNENVVINTDSGADIENGKTERPENVGQRTIEEKPASQEEVAAGLADLGL